MQQEIRSTIPNTVSRGNDGNEDVCSDTTHSEILSELAEQDTIYVGGDHEHKHKETEKSIQRYLKKNYRNLKFFSDTKINYDEPNFVYSSNRQKQQSVQICEYLLKNLGNFYFNDLYLPSVIRYLTFINFFIFKYNRKRTMFSKRKNYVLENIQKTYKKGNIKDETE